MCKRSWIAVTITLSLLLLDISAASASSPIVMHIHHTAPLDHQITLALHAFAQDVEGRTNGKIVVDVITKPRDSVPPIPPSQFVQAVADGRTEAACMPTFLWSKDIPEMDFSLIPFRFTDLNQMKAFPRSAAAMALSRKFGLTVCERSLGLMSRD